MRRHRIFLVGSKSTQIFKRLRRSIDDGDLKKVKKYLATGILHHIPWNQFVGWASPEWRLVAFTRGRADLLKLLLDYGFAYPQDLSKDALDAVTKDILMNYQPTVKHWTELREEIDGKRTDPAWCNHLCR